MMQSSTLSDNAQKPPFAYYWETIYELCLRKARCWHNRPRVFTPDDLAQIAAIKVWKAFNSYDRTSSLEPFVKKIAKNACLDACKSYEDVLLSLAMWVREETIASSDGHANNEDVDDNPVYAKDSESSASALVLEDLMENLTPRERQVIEKSYGIGVESWEQADDSIAESLGVTRQTVISDRKKAIKEMQTRVGKRTTRAMAA